ncbi:DUF3048 domain-containing protein [Candidatus Shapirobacteria bacterium]|nr:DUF3048 domain-containing protein [Candidatus Shapirobacteria bacterium]
MSERLQKITTYLGIFLVVTGVSYFAFSQLFPNGSTSLVNPGGLKTVAKPTTGQQTGSVAFSGPKTEMCPLNGELFTKEEKAIWSTRRPLMVMIENHPDSRPQSGLQNADIVYEAISEGGITRFMGVFYCNAVKGSTNKYDVGPVRSARTYFVDQASEYADYPLYTHVGGSNCSAPLDPVTGRQAGPCTTNKKAQAIEQISEYGWNNKGTWGDLSQFSLSYKVCRREADRMGKEVATEHTMYCSSSELWNTAESRGLTNTTLVNKNSWDKNFRPWLFKQSDTPSSGASSIAFDFWSGYKDFSVSWKYNNSSKLYSRSNGGQPHVDFNTSKQITTKNIVIQYVKETRSIDEHFHNLYEVVGSGKGVLLQNGTKSDITWTKSNRTARTVYRDTTGKEVNFVPGQIWVEILPIATPVTYEG